MTVTNYSYVARPSPTDADIQAAIQALIDGAPGALDTLNELAAALGDDANFATTVTNALAAKATSASVTAEASARAAADALLQPLDSDLTAIAALTAPANRIAKAPLPLFAHFATVGNTSVDGTIDTLYSDTIAAGRMAANGDVIGFQYGGTTAGSATALRDIGLSVGGNQFDLLGVGIVTANTGHWSMEGWFVRESATAVRLVVELLVTNLTDGSILRNIAFYLALGGLDLTADLALNLTATASGVGAAANDVRVRAGFVTYTPAP